MLGSIISSSNNLWICLLISFPCLSGNRYCFLQIIPAPGFIGSSNCVILVNVSFSPVRWNMSWYFPQICLIWSSSTYIRLPSLWMLLFKSSDRSYTVDARRISILLAGFITLLSSILLSCACSFCAGDCPIPPSVMSVMLGYFDTLPLHGLSCVSPQFVYFFFL